MRLQRIATVLLLLVIAASATARSAEPNLQRFSFTQPHMGTQFVIVLYAADEAAAKSAADAAYQRVVELNKILSDYDLDSELSRLSAAAPTPAPVTIGDDLRRVLVHAQGLSRQSDGAFDVTVGPLTKLWRRARRRREMPEPARLERLRQSVGYRHLLVDADRSGARLTVAGMRLDLGGIAKGYAADQAIAVLKKHGISRALVDAGGDIVVSDPPPGRGGWKIGVAPLSRDEPPSRFLEIANSAVATSGDTWQFVEIDGHRYSHILDPRTGLGLSRQGSATVWAPTGMQADSLASAVSVLGVDRGLRLINGLDDTEALLLQRLEQGDVEEHTSGSFRQLLVQ